MPCGGGPEPFQLELLETENMLCGLCRRAESLGLGDVLITPDSTLKAWWRHHKAIDDRKLAAEASQKERAKLAKKAKAKLTPQEQEALGLRG